ncbi:spermatogenesis-associated protein 5-like [Centruroides sculpturatus]|uniref:spermatogenesis-associated protein 5-like n=1 Tax=Centruroides sculpturatus TaxID=218467 RepID=UPI000C6D6D36|nr:spermatogenesis-associated protein 5-like [Centruroides sculpturatus]
MVMRYLAVKPNREIFSEAKRRAPSIIFIDEFDVLCPKYQDSSQQIERRVLATLSTLMDSLSYDDTADVFVIGATSKPNLIDESLRRPKRLDKKIETGYPNKERFEILKKLLEDKKHSLTEENMNEIAEKLHRYTGADLNYLCRNVSFMVKKKQSNDLMKPSALKGMGIQISKVYWQDIGGMHEVKQKLKEAIEWPVKHPEIFQKNRSIASSSNIAALILENTPANPCTVNFFIYFFSSFIVFLFQILHRFYSIKSSFVSSPLA